MIPMTVDLKVIREMPDKSAIFIRDQRTGRGERDGEDQNL